MPSLKMSNPVCTSCKLRKKKCDKTRPRCGYCTRKNLNCQYLSPDAKHPELTFLLMVRDPVIRSSLLLAKTLSTVLHDEPTSLDSTLYLQILRIIRLTDQTVDQICTRYFRGMHSFIPMLSPARFHKQLLHLDAAPSATFSILLLSMGLVTYHPEIVEPSTIIDQTTLYLTTKSLFTQVQSSFPGSRALIQAGVIIASYEYATQRTNEAFASIGICARMGYAAGLDIGSRTEGSDHDSQAEEASTWWGIVIAERTIFCEVHAAHQPLISTFPPRDIALPNEPLSTEWDSATFTNIASRMCGPLLDDRDGLARVIQAAWLLDRVFTACQERDLDVRLARLKRLDHALRGYLALTMDQANGRWGLFCTANAMIFRALFILHGNVIYGTTGVARSSSYVAVETIIQMVQDIAATQHNMSLVDLDTLPPSRAFVFQAALQYLDELGAEGDRLDIVRTQITASLRMFGERWKAAPLIV